MDVELSISTRRLMAACLLAAATCALAGCYEEKQTVTLNPDGSGKIFVEMNVAVPAADAPGRPKPTAATFGKLVVAGLINKTQGVDAWSDLAISETEDHRAHVEMTAYFKDLNKLKFDMPLEFHWQREGDGATFTVQRTRTAVNTGANLSDAEIKSLIAKSKTQYKDQQLALRTQLTAFTLTLAVELPGEPDAENLMKRDGNTCSVILDGKKAADALDKFMFDDEALAATFKRGKDTAENDDIMLKSMYGQAGPVKAHTKLPADVAPLFDYKIEMTAALLMQSEMLKAAGVELIPRFIVKDAETAPAKTRGK